jgi:hypothetical protein
MSNDQWLVTNSNNEEITREKNKEKKNQIKFTANR